MPHRQDPRPTRRPRRRHHPASAPAPPGLAPPASPHPTPPAATTPASAQAPTEAQLDNIIGIAEWTIGGPLTPDEKAKIRSAVRAGAENPLFRQTAIDVPVSDIGALYRLPPAAQAAGREEAIFGRNGLYLAAIDLPGFPDPDHQFRRLARAILDGYHRILAATPPTAAQYDQAIAGLEGLFGGSFLPDEAAPIRAAFPAMLAIRPRDTIELICAAHALIAWSATSTDSERTRIIGLMLPELRSAAGGQLHGDPVGPEMLAASKALLAAYGRLHPTRP